MTRIRIVSIKNFRCLKQLQWYPISGLNCLVGSGDSGKSSILDAIDYCLGARRSIQASDADFYNLDINQPIEISLTLGALDDDLKSIDGYGLYLRGYDPATFALYDEPGAGLETVLTVALRIESDLEPQWSLISDRAQAQGLTKTLAWKDRVRLTPTRLGAATDYHLGWRKGSLLHKISDDTVDPTNALTDAARAARAAFGGQANSQLANTLQAVTSVAHFLGIRIGTTAQALLDTSAISFNGGTVTLHDEYSVPLDRLGLGSMRLLTAGLQRHVAAQASIILIDELEYGLEPHRIMRFLDALGAKDNAEPLQVFMTTHSPVAVRELSVNQLMLVRRDTSEHRVFPAAVAGDVQGTVRLFPEALLAPTILVCEGASEVGLMRGLDQFMVGSGYPSLYANGVALVDGGGDTAAARACALQSLGYRVALLRDSDLPAKPEEATFLTRGGQVFAWQNGYALEDALFYSLSDTAVWSLLDLAVQYRDEEVMSNQIVSKSGNTLTLATVQQQYTTSGFSPNVRTVLGQASRSNERKKSWYKSVSIMEIAGRDIVGPGLGTADPQFRTVIDGIFAWIRQ